MSTIDSALYLFVAMSHLSWGAFFMYSVPPDVCLSAMVRAGPCSLSDIGLCMRQSK